MAVIGGGNSGVEAAIDLAGIVAPCHPPGIRRQTPGRRRAAEKLYSLPNVTVVTQAQTTEVRGDGAKVTASCSGPPDRRKPPPSNWRVFVQIGLLPNTDWLKARLALAPRRNRGRCPGRTSLRRLRRRRRDDGAYKQIVIALGGAKAALAAFDHLIRSSVVEETLAKAADRWLSPVAQFGVIPVVSCWVTMRIISTRTLREILERHPQAEIPLRAWYAEVSNADWKTPADIKAVHRKPVSWPATGWSSISGQRFPG